MGKLVDPAGSAGGRPASRPFSITSTPCSVQKYYQNPWCTVLHCTVQSQCTGVQHLQCRAELCSAVWSRAAPPCLWCLGAQCTTLHCGHRLSKLALCPTTVRSMVSLRVFTMHHGVVLTMHHGWCSPCTTAAPWRPIHRNTPPVTECLTPIDVKVPKCNTIINDYSIVSCFLFFYEPY